jgi:hypothetical protein
MVRKFNPPDVKTGDRLADEPVNAKSGKMVNFHVSVRPVAA